MSGPENWLDWYMLVCGAALALLGLVMAARRWRAIAGGERALARIVDYEPGPLDEFGDRRHEMPVFEFNVLGRSERARSETSMNPKTYPLDSFVTVSYPPGKPERAQPIDEPRHRWAPAAILLFAGLLIAIALGGADAIGVHRTG